MKIKQSDTAIQHFRDPVTQRLLHNHEEIVLAILTARAPGNMTLKEIACRLNEWTGYAVPDSSLCAPLAMLKAKGKITDKGPKRACLVNGIRKKVWAITDTQGKEATENPPQSDAFAVKSDFSG